MWRTVLNTASGCTFMAEEQGSSACEGQGYSGCGRGGDMGQHCGKTVTLLKKNLSGFGGPGWYKYVETAYKE